ncbi:hypothetical protein C3B64_12320 [Clostridium botulinum]|uniref:Uncharacterized protein n=2 Tax=Clostridium TaxID=1485 RepID=A0AAU8YXX7_CLOBO|nr:hypothetical protein [Clostridium sporogenes]AVP64995.1 hypothetical protein C3B64_12320 [Clostridium botulinum]MBA4509912.1 hypothetical protein [Clostridium sporogenes]MCF4017752.1 hypothetical protein [Clostridium sporogenes]NFG03597.1 hypothetical protein [Clostridium sporogenes]
MKKLTDLLAALVAIGFCAFIILGISFIAKEVGLNPNFILSLTILFSIPTIGTFSWFIFCTIFKPKKGKKITAEQIFYKQKVYPLYLETRNCFRIALQNKMITRKEILEFKSMLNKALVGELGTYKKYKFENDAHEIYTKLKDHHIRETDMVALKDYIIPYAVASTVYNMQPTSKPYLKVIK